MEFSHPQPYILGQNVTITPFYTFVGIPSFIMNEDLVTITHTSSCNFVAGVNKTCHLNTTVPGSKLIVATGKYFATQFNTNTTILIKNSM